MANVWSSTKLLEFDFAGIEAKLLGWCMRDPFYMRLAGLGMHAYVASHALNRPADLAWDDARLGEYFRAIKKAEDQETKTAYETCKRVVHGTGYGQTPMGIFLTHRKLFPSLARAQHIYDIYMRIAPSVPTFHTAVRRTAHERHFLGGAAVYQYDPEQQRVSGHPYQYQHWFWSVVTYQRLTVSQRLWREKRRWPVEEINGIWYGIQLGEDAKRCAAYYPQSIARGVLTEAAFPLFDPEAPLADSCYIGDLYYGETPLRAPIHDSLFFECPTRKVDQLIERVAYAMQRPVEALPCDPAWGQGTHLSIGVDAKIGDDWGNMSPLALPAWQEIGVSNDLPPTAAEEEDEDELQEWATPLGAQP